MSSRLGLSLLMALLMMAASVFAVALRPTEKIADLRPKVDLEQMIPRQFAEWRVDESIVPLLPAPDVEAQLNKIYNQTLARTYVDARGNRIMLSIAYGGDQSDSMQVHKPEVCYPAQGFQLAKQSYGVLSSPYGDIPVKRLVATQGRRIEPITYWITIGDSVAVNSTSWKLRQLRYGLAGKVPDGLLFRVSMITANDAEAFRMQDEFVKRLLAAVSEPSRVRLVGGPVS